MMIMMMSMGIFLHSHFKNGSSAFETGATSELLSSYLLKLEVSSSLVRVGLKVGLTFLARILLKEITPKKRWFLMSLTP